jgi:hypothetical protein
LLFPCLALKVFHLNPPPLPLASPSSTRYTHCTPSTLSTIANNWQQVPVAFHPHTLTDKAAASCASALSSFLSLASRHSEKHEAGLAAAVAAAASSAAAAALGLCEFTNGRTCVWHDLHALIYCNIRCRYIWTTCMRLQHVNASHSFVILTHGASNHCAFGSKWQRWLIACAKTAAFPAFFLWYAAVCSYQKSFLQHFVQVRFGSASFPPLHGLLSFRTERSHHSSNQRYFQQHLPRLSRTRVIRAILGS